MTGNSAIESSTGTITQCTYGGTMTSGTAAGMTEQWSYCPVTLNPGDKFFIRASLTTTGGYLPAFEKSMNTAFGDAIETTATDKTLSGTITQNGNGFDLSHRDRRQNDSAQRGFDQLRFSRRGGGGQPGG